jgi:hypothetical protein
VRKRENAHRLLVQIVRILDSDYYDACQKSGHAIEKFEDEALYQWSEIRIKVLLNRLTQMMRPDNSVVIQNHLVEAVQKIEKGQQEEARLWGIIRELRMENQQLTTHLAATQQVQRPANNSALEVSEPNQAIQQETKKAETVGNEPDWMHEWRSGRTFTKESAALILISETGKCLRPTLVDLLARKLNLSPTNSRLSEAFNRLMGLDASGGLIEFLDVFTQPGASTCGNHPDILHLTERGRNAYQYLTGHLPLENEYERLIHKHKTPEHTVLNI